VIFTGTSFLSVFSFIKTFYNQIAQKPSVIPNKVITMQGGLILPCAVVNL